MVRIVKVNGVDAAIDEVKGEERAKHRSQFCNDEMTDAERIHRRAERIRNGQPVLKKKNQETRWD